MLAGELRLRRPFFEPLLVEAVREGVHIVDLPCAEAARELAELERCSRAGLCDHHLIRTDLLVGVSARVFRPSFLVIADLPAAAASGHPTWVPDYAALPHERQIVHDELITP